MWEYIERKRRMGGGIYMSDQVKFVGVHREREREREKNGGLYIYVGSSKIRGST